MKVNIPNRAISPGAKTFDRVLQDVAARTGYPPGAVHLVVTHLLERIVYEVCRGDTVLIRGFGQFGSRDFKQHRDASPIVVPWFVPSRGLRQEVRACSLTSTRSNEATMRRYQKANRASSLKGRSHQRVFKTQERERQRLLSDATTSVELD